ncbi:DUF4124 domain-containing protein [Paracidovorax sp. MALMAid1276]|uniref:DUF4124 domain-containing protein n=1 Tax=Paracidovorax sp. MALMAid1276 TaxID=3411631 RepID=UPI003B9ABC9D
MVCLVGWSASAQAQVVRCTDPRTGQVTYTDGTCAGGASVREVEPRKTPQELQQERELAAEALERRQQRLQAEAAAADATAQRNAERARARAAQTAAAAPQPHDYARSPECARSRRSLDIVASGVARSAHEQELRLDAAQRQVDLDCLGPQGYAEVEKARANQPRVVVVPPVQPRAVFPEPFPPIVRPQPAPYLTQCGDFRCTDNLGNTYPRAGPGRFPGQGGVCRSNGGQAPC